MGRVSKTTRNSRLPYRWRIWIFWSSEQLGKCLLVLTLTFPNHKATWIRRHRLLYFKTWRILVLKLPKSINHDLKSRSSIKTLRSPIAIEFLVKNAKSKSPATRKWTRFTCNIVISLTLYLLRFRNFNKLWNIQVKGNLHSVAIIRESGPKKKEK